MKKLLLTLLLLSAWFCRAQIFSGQIYIRENAAVYLNQIFVTNLSTDKSLLSDFSGAFSIPAAPGDVIRFTSIISERKDVKLSPSNLTSPRNLVELSPLYHDIPEVVIAFKPTGNLRKDVAALKAFDKPLKIAQIIGLPEPKGDGYSPTAPVAAFQNGGLSFSVDTIWDMITGNQAKKERLKRYETMMNGITDIKNYFGKDFFVKMKIPPNLIDNFLQFVYSSDNLQPYIAAKDLEGTKPFLEKYLPIYLKRLENSNMTQLFK